MSAIISKATKRGRIDNTRRSCDSQVISELHDQDNVNLYLYLDFKKKIN